MLMSDVQQIQNGNASEFDTIDHVDPATSNSRVTITWGALTHQGKVRSNNEDHFLVAKLAKSMQICQTSLKNLGETQFSDEDGYLMVVADGMGGAAAGERASALAVESVEAFALNTLMWFLHQEKADESILLGELRKALEQADRAVYNEAEGNARFYGMGTTLTMTYSVGRDLYIVHAGDSRAYLFREGHLEQVTSDHTLVQLLVSGGVLSSADAKTHARRNIVTNVIGGPSEGVHAEIHKVRLEDGDVVLLCTDGLTEPVEDALIEETLTKITDPDDAAHQLVALALERGGPDNVTAIVARYSVEDEPAKAS
jgi:protein phosphatase